jgi:hypothetical protein
MSFNESRREFIGRSFRIGGLLVAFSSWTGWSILKHGGLRLIDAAAPVPSRLLISNPNDIIEHFLNARGAVLSYYFQVFFPFVAGNEYKMLTDLQDLCQQRMKTANSTERARLRVLPAIAAAHMLPILSDEDTVNVSRDLLLKINRSALSGGDPSRSVLGLLWTSMTSVVIRNRSHWRNFLVGRDMVFDASERCLEFMREEESTLPLIHTAVAAWQFLLTYERSLMSRKDNNSALELQSVRAAIKRVQEGKGVRYIWLDKVSKIYQRRKSYEDMLPEYLELIIGRSKTEVHSTEREVADFFVLLRLQAIYIYYLVESRAITSPYLSDPDEAGFIRKRAFCFLVNFGVTPNDWKSLKLQGQNLLTEDCLQYLDAMFENYDLLASQAGAASGIEREHMEWYSMNVPFRNLLPEEVAAAEVYTKPENLKSALEVLESTKELSAREALCLPAVAYGVAQGVGPKIALGKLHDILEEVKKASLKILGRSQYDKGFELLSKSGPAIQAALVENLTIIPARLHLVGNDGRGLFRGKEMMEQAHQEESVDDSIEEFGTSTESKAEIRGLFFANVRSAGIPEDLAKEFIDGAPVDDSIEEFGTSTESKAEIRGLFFANVRSAGIPEELAKEFIDGVEFTCK